MCDTLVNSVHLHHYEAPPLQNQNAADEVVALFGFSTFHRRLMNIILLTATFVPQT